MSSFWQSSLTKIRQKPSKTLNQSLPTLTHNDKTVKNKGYSQSIHQILASNEAKIIANKQNPTIKNLTQKKQTMINLCSRSMYKLPSKHRTLDIPVIQFGQALLKIEEVFNQQFNISQNETKRMKKTSQGKVTLKKLNEFQNIVMESNTKKYAKRQFQQIFRLFDRIPLKCMQNSVKRQKQDQFLRTRKNNTINFNVIHQRQHSQQKRYQQNLTQHQKQEFMKQTQAFQKAEKHLMLKSFTVKIFYHHLNSQLAIEAGRLDQALYSLYYCEYYARKIDFDFYIVPCLIMQSEVKQSMYEFDQAIKILKTALQFSIVKRWKQLQMRILEKVSIVYYYRGNSYMAKYYKQMSQTGMPQAQLQIYIKEYSKSQELRSLEARLFSLPFDGISKKKHNQKYELDISRDLFLDHQNMITSHHEEVSSMIRSNKTSKIGIKLRKLIIQTGQKAQVTIFSHKRNDSETLPRFIASDYPMEHCNQILKSHLSKGRLTVGHKTKSINFIKTLNYMKTLYRRLNYQLMNERNLQQSNEKQNLYTVNR